MTGMNQRYFQLPKEFVPTYGKYEDYNTQTLNAF